MIQRYELVGLVILVILALLPPGLTLLAFLDWLRSRVTQARRRKWLPSVALAADLILALCLVDGFVIEPNRLTVTRISDTNSIVSSRTGELKVVHISDIHFERNDMLRAKVLSTVGEQKPDLIVLTGDIPQLGRFDKTQLYEWLRRLRRIAPVYSVAGYEDDALLAASPVGDGFLPSHEHVVETEVRGTKIVIQDLRASTHRTDGALRIVLDHRPDSIPDAALLGADWYFCGHTHGGQVRLPFWGAIVTASETGKQYEYGRYRVAKMQAFVTRGIGLEPRPAPQVRFLCPPEIVVLRISRSVGQ